MKAIAWIFAIGLLMGIGLMIFTHLFVWIFSIGLFVVVGSVIFAGYMINERFKRLVTRA